MGESKRRKLLDPNYGKAKIECFLGKARISDGHAIYVSIPRDDQYRIVSVHNGIKRAYEVMLWCRRVLDEMIFHPNKSPDDTFTKFIHKLIEMYGDYDSDDAQYILENGEIKPISDPVIKTFVPICFPSSELTGTNIEYARIGISYMTPSAYECLYCVATMKDLRADPKEVIAKSILAGLSQGMISSVPAEPQREIDKLLMVKGSDSASIFSSYFTAAYVADYLCENNLTHEIEKSLLEKLWTEANELQGKI